MRVLLMVALLSAMTLAGCLVDEPNEPAGPFAEENLGFDADEGPKGEPAAGTSGSHAEPTINEGPEQSSPPDTQNMFWRTSQIIEIHNDFGGASKSIASLSVAVGSISIAPSPDGNYAYTLELVGLGGTEQESRNAFDDLRWGHTDELDGRTLQLDTFIENTSPTSNGISCSGIGPLAQCTGRSWRGHITAFVPDEVAYDLEAIGSTADITVHGLKGSEALLTASTGDVDGRDLSFATLRTDTSTGDVTVQGIKAGTYRHDSSTGDLTGSNIQAAAIVVEVSTATVHLTGISAGRLSATASSGDVTARGAADIVHVATTTGDHDLDLEFGDATLTASTGDIVATLDPTRTGRVGVSTSTGEVDLNFAGGTDHGFDVEGDTSTGDIRITVANSETLEDDEDRVRKRTNGYASKAIRTEVDVETSTGDITVDA